jgi:adenylosuccinate lyase
VAGLDRYTLLEMKHLWSDEHRLQLWAAVAAVQAASQLAEGADRSPLIATLMEYKLPSVGEVADMESLVKHDVVAFLHVWREQMAPEHASLVHLGLTSSDLADTALNALLGQVTDQILDAADALQVTVARTALKHWGTERLGRTHGQPAEVTTLGFQLARHAYAIHGNVHRLTTMMDDLMLFKMSGPIGTYRYTTIEQERRGAVALGEAFSAAEVAGQRLSRESYARWVSELAILASSVEDLALQIRLGQQFGIEELAEPFDSQQVGSSSMPHKRNPIRSENLCGLARLVRAQVVPVMEGIPTWNDRDISHSSVERVALQTASILTHYMLTNAQWLIENLNVDLRRLKSNIQMAGHRAGSAAYKVLLTRAGVAPNQVDHVVDNAIRQGTVASDVFGKAAETTTVRFPNYSPPMRVEHVRQLMEEIARAD